MFTSSSIVAQGWFPVVVLNHFAVDCPIKEAFTRVLVSSMILAHIFVLFTLVTF